MDLNSPALKSLSLDSQRSLPVVCCTLVMLALRIFSVIASAPDSRVAMNDIDAALGVGDFRFRRTGSMYSAKTSSLGCFGARKPGLYDRSRTHGHSSCLCLLLIELNPFSSRRIGIEKEPSPFSFLFLFQKHATLHIYAPIISAVIATMIASLKSDHIRLSFSSADSTELVDSPSSSSISSAGFGESGSDSDSI